jgi:hypothetical protein
MPGPDDQGGHQDQATPTQHEEGRWSSPQPGMETAHPHSQRMQEA